jgi:fumarate reductase subunit D
VTVHLATILYAVRTGATAEEVLGRTRENIWFLAFYLLFVLAIAIRAPIGLRNIRANGRAGAGAAAMSPRVFAVILLLLGVRARSRFICRLRVSAMIRLRTNSPAFRICRAGIALAIFLPIHFLALATAINGADALDAFLNVTQTPVLKFAEGVIVVALALHMTLGLRVLAVEFLPIREHTSLTISICLAAAVAVGLLFVFNVG